MCCKTFIMHTISNSTALRFDEIRVTQYQNALDNVGAPCTLRDCLEWIRSAPSLKQWSEQLRPLYWKAEGLRSKQTDEASKAAYQTAKRIYDEEKKQLSAFTFSGRFTTRSKEGLETYTGIIQVDLDHLKSKDIDIADLRRRVAADPHVAFSFPSISGDGLKCGVRVATGAEEHLNAFLAIQRYWEATYEIRPDDVCKDIGRLSFFSSDPDIHINENAIPLDWKPWDQTHQAQPRMGGETPRAIVQASVVSNK